MVEQERAEARHGRLELGDVDEAALAGAIAVLEAGEHGGQRVQAGEVVGRGDGGDAGGLLVGVAGEGVETDERRLVRAPRQELVVRLGGVRAEAGQRHVHDARG